MNWCSFFTSLTISLSLLIPPPTASAAVPGWISTCARLLGAKAKPDPFKKLVTEDLGFDADFEGTALIERAIENYVRSQPGTSPEDIDIQVLRDLENLEKTIGWGRLWTGNYQAALNRRGAIDGLATRSFDGLLYLPGPDEKSVMVYGDTHDVETPEQLIQLANGGKAVVVSDIKILQAPREEKGILWSLKFSAVVRPLDPSRALQLGEKILSEEPSEMKSNTGFLVEPFNVDRETIALSKTTDGTHILHVRTGYRFSTRLGQDQTLNFKDIEDTLTTALRDAGISQRMTRKSWARAKTIQLMTIQLDESVSSEDRLRFEREMIRRVSELKDFKNARISRLAPFADGPKKKKWLWQLKP